MFSIWHSNFNNFSNSTNNGTVKKEVKMNLFMSLEILSKLSNGLNPVTGENLPDNSLYNHPDVLRALFFIVNFIKIPPKKAKKTLEDRQANNIAQGRPENSNLPWTDEVKKEVGAQYNASVPIYKLAENFGRSQGSIRAVLIQQGLIEDDKYNQYYKNKP